VRVKAQQAGFSFSVQQLLEHPTVAALAARESGGGGAAATATTATGASPAAEEISALAPFSLLAPEDLLALPGDAADAYPCTSMQLGMLLHGELGGRAAIFHDVIAIRVTASWDRAALVAALRQAAGLHPVLRTSFHLTAFSEPIQIVHRTAEVPLAVIDLTRLPAREQERVVVAWVKAETRRRFVRERAPLLRIAVHLLGGASFHFGLTHHHAILDGWSAATFLAELFESYMGSLAGRPPPERAAPAVGLRELVALERQAIGSEETRRFWSERLGGAEHEPFPRWQVGPPGPGPRPPRRQGCNPCRSTPCSRTACTSWPGCSECQSRACCWPRISAAWRRRAGATRWSPA